MVPGSSWTSWYAKFSRFWAADRLQVSDAAISPAAYLEKGAPTAGRALVKRSMNRICIACVYEITLSSASTAASAVSASARPYLSSSSNICRGTQLGGMVRHGCLLGSVNSGRLRFLLMTRFYWLPPTVGLPVFVSVDKKRTTQPPVENPCFRARSGVRQRRNIRRSLPALPATNGCPGDRPMFAQQPSD